MQTGQERRRSEGEACDEMAKLLNRSLGLNLDGEVVARMFKAHWLKLSLLAHEIHDAQSYSRAQHHQQDRTHVQFQ